LVLGWKIEGTRGCDAGSARARALIGRRHNYPAMEVGEELHQIVAARQCAFGMALFHFDNPEAGAGKSLRRDGFGESRRMEAVALHAGMRTGRLS
jgi:hypothetical protein